MAEDWADDLLDDLDDVEALEGGFVEFPAGNYPAIVSAYDTWQSEDGDRRSVRFHYEVTEGPMQGQTYQHWFNIPLGPKTDAEVQKALGYVKGNFVKIGVPEGPFNEDAIKGIPVVFVLTAKDGKGKHAGRTFINLTSIAPRETGVPVSSDTASSAPAEVDEDPFA